MTLLRRLLLVLASLLAIAPASFATGPSLLFDVTTGEVISQDRAGEPWYPASLTKLMTAYVVFGKIRTGRLRLSDRVTVSELARSQPPSKIGVESGKTVTVDLALQALLVYSANDMAYVLAEAASGSVEAFVNEMNRTAAALGMSGTFFANPNGLHDPRNISTARDMAILTMAIVRDFPEHAAYFSQTHLQIGKRKLPNRNSLLRQMPTADGMKTGFVCNSGYNLVATATQHGRRLGAVIFGANSGKHRADVAEMLLVDGFSRTHAPRIRITDIANLKTGSIVPADLTTKVCKHKPPVTVSNAREAIGWGISFGNYAAAQHADMALRGRLLSPAGRGLSGTPAVMRMPGKGGFAALIWNLDQEKSLSACARYREEGAPCDVLTPETFAHIATLTPEPSPKAETSQAEGSDSSGNKARAPRKSRTNKRKN